MSAKKENMSVLLVTLETVNKGSFFSCEFTSCVSQFWKMIHLTYSLNSQQMCIEHLLCVGSVGVLEVLCEKGKHNRCLTQFVDQYIFWCRLFLLKLLDNGVSLTPVHPRLHFILFFSVLICNIIWPLMKGALLQW